MPVCFVQGCKTTHLATNRNRSPVTFHKVRQEWLHIIGRPEDTFLIQQKICSLHFEKSDIIKIGEGRNIKVGAMPTKKLPHSSKSEMASRSQDHFDDNQFEQHRMDGRKKLSPTALPAIHEEDISLCEVFIKEEKIDDDFENLETKPTALEPENALLFKRNLVWLDHNYCKEWKEDIKLKYSLDEITFWKNEAERLTTELDIKNQELCQAKEIIETLSKQLVKTNHIRVLPDTVSEYT